MTAKSTPRFLAADVAACLVLCPRYSGSIPASFKVAFIHLLMVVVDAGLCGGTVVMISFLPFPRSSLVTHK